MRATKPVADARVSRVGKSGLPAIHPGEFLREILDELGLTQTAFTDVIGVSPMRVSHLLKGDRPITAELALRLGRALGQTSQYCLNLQTAYDLKIPQVAMRASLDAVRKLAVLCSPFHLRG